MPQANAAGARSTTRGRRTLCSNSCPNTIAPSRWPSRCSKRPAQVLFVWIVVFALYMGWVLCVWVRCVAHVGAVRLGVLRVWVLCVWVAVCCSYVCPLHCGCGGACPCVVCAAFVMILHVLWSVVGCCTLCVGLCFLHACFCSACASFLFTVACCAVWVLCNRGE
jgi:hypothetical protein